MSRHWGVILAGGDGVRLRSMTRRIAGDDRPKQFCALVGDETLLTETRRRAALAVPAHRTLVVVNRAHERFYTPLLADLRTRLVLAQPENRGTAPAILYALLVLAARQAASDTVVFYPSDHFVSDDASFSAQIEEAFAGTARRPDLVTLLGIAPDRAEPGYGWIEPGEPVAGAPAQREVRRFWEKPAMADAERFRAQGWLWNSFVMVGRVSTMLALVRLTAPDLHRSFAEIAATLGTLGETPALERLYCGLPSVDFSRQVLSARPDGLAVLPVRGVHWNDLGDPERVLATRRRARTVPELALIPVSISASTPAERLADDRAPATDLPADCPVPPNPARRRACLIRMDGTMRQALRGHWPEYLMEAAHLGLFMISACVFATLLYHPASPVGPGSSLGRDLGDDLVRRLLMGIAMAATAVAIIYSPWGRRSGAHFNPAVTLTFWRLGKIAAWDAAFYITAQFLGGLAGVVVARVWLGVPVAHPVVHYAVTVPGSAGPLVALGAEIAISFMLMLVVLTVSNSRAAALTGLCSGLLVATYITLEAPLSGMSMNPARTLASAIPAGTWTALWVYFTGPLIGMLVAADVYLLLARGREALCAKLYHHPATRCIFRCGYAGRSATTVAPAGPWVSASVVGALWLLVLLAVATPAVVAQPAGGPDTEAGRVREVGAIGLTVSDMERSVAFYRDVLGFEKTADAEVAGPAYEQLTGLAGLRARVVSMRLGAERIELTEFLAARGRAAPADSRSNDVWFQHVAIITNDIEQGYLWLRRHNVRQVSPEPQRLPDWNPKAGGIKAFYFRDPDGHPLEILEFPPDKGEARWHRPSDRIFLGIDHTAIVVTDTGTSLRFYRDVLGMRVAGESENWGPEQERLNDVVGARLRISTLRAASGPGVELLEYLTPRTGRSAPADPAVNDLAHWHTTVVPADPAATATRLRVGRAPFISPGVVMLPDRALGFGAGFLARDPDGHALRVTGPEGVR